MDPTILEVIRQSPILACFLALVWIGSRWIEKQETKCHALHEKLTDSYEARCIEMRAATDQLNSVLGHVGAALDRCAKSHEEMERTMRGRTWQ
jgi:hypothetical protein